MVSKKKIGFAQNRDIYEFSIENGNLRVDILEYGAAIHNIFFNGTDCVTGYDNIEGYLNGKSCQGGTVGRFANRIENAVFSLNGMQYNLDVNNGNNCLHGGINGFAKKYYLGEVISDNAVSFSISSPDGESGFPGNLTMKATFSVENDTLRIEYDIVSDKDTIVNPTNHVYFNLGAKNCLDTNLRITADYFTPAKENMIPFGNLEKVENTPFDFRNSKKIGSDIYKDNIQLKTAKGYDHNFVLSLDRSYKKDIIEAFCEETGIGLTCSTDMPGVQLYTASCLNEPCGKGGKPLTQYAAFCLETQFFPNSPNEPSFPSCIIKANEKFNSVTEYRFFKEK